MAEMIRYRNVVGCRPRKGYHGRVDPAGAIPVPADTGRDRHMVHAAPMQKSNEYLLKLRREAGAWLARKRTQARLTQKGLARLVGFE